MGDSEVTSGSAVVTSGNAVVTSGSAVVTSGITVVSTSPAGGDGHVLFYTLNGQQITTVKLGFYFIEVGNLLLYGSLSLLSLIHI